MTEFSSVQPWRNDFEPRDEFDEFVQPSLGLLSVSEPVYGSRSDDMLLGGEDKQGYIHIVHTADGSVEKIHESKLTEKDADGTKYVNFRGAEIHWGTTPDSRYLLQSSTLKGSDQAGNTHQKFSDGTMRVDYMDGEHGYLNKKTADGTRYLLSFGERPNESFLAVRDRAGNAKVAYLDIDSSALTPQALDRLIQNRSKLNFLTERNANTQIGDLHNRVMNKYLSQPRDLWDQVKVRADLIAFENRQPILENSIRRSGHYVLPIDYARVNYTEGEAREKAIQEITSSLRNIERILDSRQYQDRERSVLAREVASHCAQPDTVDQGIHPTCTVAALEARTYARHPGQASRLIAEIAERGSYSTTRSNLSVQLDFESLKPDRQANYTFQDDGTRDFASQLFQLAATNVYFAGKEPKYLYRQFSFDERGEHKFVEGVFKDRRPSDLLKSKNPVWDWPHLGNDDLCYIGEEITGGKEPDWLFSYGSKLSGRWGQSMVSSVSELERELLEAKENGSFPVLVGVHTDKEPFKTDQHDSSEPGGWHKASIYDYDPVSKRVSIDNQWGCDDDHIRQERRLTLEQVLNSMRGPKGNSRSGS